MLTTKNNNSTKQLNTKPVEYIGEVSKAITFPEGWSGFPINGHFYQRRAS